MQTQKELIEAIAANPVYKRNSGLRRRVARALIKLSASELQELHTIIVAKGGIKLE